MRVSFTAIGAIALTLLIGVLIIANIFVFEVRSIPSGSMNPTYQRGDVLLVYKLGYGTYGYRNITFVNEAPSVDIEAGEAIVFAHPIQSKVDYLMRVVGLPGDTIELNASELTINDVPMPAELKTTNTPEIFRQTISNRSFDIRIASSGRAGKSGAWRVPEDHLFVLGDNRNKSNDSRYWGFVPLINVKGVAKTRLWPWRNRNHDE